MTAALNTEILQERIAAGVARVRAQGTRSGKPIGQGKGSTRPGKRPSGRRWRVARAF
jgi:hypothetical protein